VQCDDAVSNVAAYAVFAQPYDSLSDVYLANGQKDLALQKAKKRLDLLGKYPRDPVARGTTFVIAQNKSEAVGSDIK